MIWQGGRLGLFMRSFYKSTPYRRWRDAVLKKANYKCERCARYGRTLDGMPVPAVVAHHKKPLEAHPELGLRVDNGEALCARCHNEAHPEKGRHASGYARGY